jgi:eukaryotic-like serine/threonine-protein kinase
VTVQRGKRIGRYEILNELGRGGMSRVYRARDLQLQRIVALKVLAAPLSTDSEYLQRFEREARIAAQLHHPHIVTVYDIGSDDHQHFIAMEYIAGRSVAALLQRHGALAPALVLTIVTAVAAALDTAHRAGAVHRDIKPHNILIDRHGRVILTDFGIAQTTENDSRLTRTGVFMGTPEYLSPEQAEARRVDGRSDLYGLAVVAYEMLSGRVPFQGATTQLLVAHVQTPPPPLTAVAPQLPAALDAVLARGMAKRPEDRFQSGAELAAALTAALQPAGISSAEPAALADLVQQTADQTELLDPLPAAHSAALPAASPQPERSDRLRRSDNPAAAPTEPPAEPRRTGAQPLRAPAPHRGSGRDNQAVLYMLGALLAVIAVALVTLTVRALFAADPQLPTSVPASPTAGDAAVNPTIVATAPGLPVDGSPTPRPTRTLYPTFTPSPGPSTAAATATLRPTLRPSAVPTASAAAVRPTTAPTTSATASVTATASATASVTATASATASVTATASATASVTATASATASVTATASATPTVTPSVTASPSPTATDSATEIPTPTETPEPETSPVP